jgi:L-fuculose-phosphate aldolase
MQEQRQQLLDISRELCRLGLNRGTSGNASVRVSNNDGLPGFLITPSGMAVDQMTVDDMVWMDFSANWVGCS